MNVQPAGLSLYACATRTRTRRLLYGIRSTLRMPGRTAALVARVAVSIVSNSTLLSEGLFALLAARLPLEQVARYPAGLTDDGDYDGQARPNPPGHIVLIDGSIGSHAAQVWTHYWRTRTPPAHVLVLEMSNDVELIVDCIEAGVGGYILQGDSIEEVVRAHRRGSAGAGAVLAGSDGPPVRPPDEHAPAAP